MALRIFQLCVVFTVGFHFGLAQALSGAADAGVKTIPLSINLKDPEDVIVAKRQPATLRCDYHVTNRSTGDVRVIWFHNNKTVSVKDPRRILQEDGSLYIPKVTAGKKGSAELTGEYKCLINTTSGSLISNSAKLEIAYLDKEFEKQPLDETVVVGQPVVIHCKIHSIPPATVQWERNDLPLPHSTKYVPLPSGSLLITAADSSDKGSYRCLAKNSILDKTVYGNYGELSLVSPSGYPEAPSFLPLDIPLKSSVLLGKTAKLVCAVTGWPLPTINWHHNNRYILGNSSVLTVHATDIKSGGNYTCTANNSQGHISQTYILEVQQRPYFNVTPTSKIYPSAITVRLDCQPVGVPEPTVYWLKNSKPLPIGGRIKWQRNGRGLVLSHTFTYDSGFYQCVAENAAGKAWTAAELVLMEQTPTSPPENLKCRPYDETSICLTWQAPANVTAQAYSIYSFYTGKVKGMGNNSVTELDGPEFIANRPYTLATDLAKSTNYTFYVRLYSRKASDQSNRVTCQTGIEGRRNLHIVALNNDSVQLSWSKVSTDTGCNGTEGIYQVKWRRKGLRPFAKEETRNFTHIIHGLKPKTWYEFNIASSVYQDRNPVWTSFYFEYGNPEYTGNDINTTEIVPIAPEKLQATALSANVVNLSWTDQNANIAFFQICYVEVSQNKNCESGEKIISAKNFVEISRLKPDTSYEFRVQSQNFDNVIGPYSQPVRIRTPFDVPSPVVNLNYTLINDSTVCLHWQTPQFSQAEITEYIVTYTPDKNWPLEKWNYISVPLNDSQRKGCTAEDDDVSVLLTDLKLEENYTLFVRAVSEVGSGKPVIPIEISTKNIFTEQMNSNWEPVNYIHIIGLVLGIFLILGLIGLFIFIRIFTLKRRRRRESRIRRTPSQSYCPAVAHYATQGSSVQVRLEEAADIHEIENLVDEDHGTHIPPVDPVHLDTKGGNCFPNGHINGCTKPYMNGHIPNGHVHITENPQYYDERKQNEKKNYSPHFEDSNSNLQASKFRDLQKLFENSKKSPSYQQCNPHLEGSPGNVQDRLLDRNPYDLVSSSVEDLELEDSLNSTQVTDLNDSVRSRRRLSPILGPNG